MSKEGALLASGPSRYDELDAYVAMFGSPLSQLRGAYWWTFADPISDLVLLVHCAEVDWCGQCNQSLEDCACAF
jgi:hypothetical protein